MPSVDMSTTTTTKWSAVVYVNQEEGKPEILVTLHTEGTDQVYTRRFYMYQGSRIFHVILDWALAGRLADPGMEASQCRSTSNCFGM